MERVTRAIKNYYEKYEEGDFHIVIGDINVRDCHLDYCVKIAKERYDDALELSAALKEYSDEENVRGNKIIEVVGY
jgi:hypothetical protein